MSEVLAQLEKKGGDNKTHYTLACNYYGQYSTLFVDGVPQNVNTTGGGYTFAGVKVATNGANATITNNSGETIYATKQDSMTTPMYTAIPNGGTATIPRCCVCAVI